MVSATDPRLGALGEAGIQAGQVVPAESIVDVCQEEVPQRAIPRRDPAHRQGSLDQLDASS